MPSHFAEIAPAYARARPSYPAQVADWLAAVAPGRDVVWEAGCGSGQLSTLLGDRFARIVASDLSREQIAHAAAHARVRYVVAAAERSPLRDACADLVVAAQAAHWFDLPRYFAEADRVARSGGVVALVGYGNAALDDDELERRFVRFYDEEVGEYWPPERRILIDGYRSLDFPFDAIDAPDLVLRRSWTADEMLAYVDTWSAMRRARAAGQGARFDAFAAELRELWGERRREVTWPLPIRAGTRR